MLLLKKMMEIFAFGKEFEYLLIVEQNHISKNAVCKINFSSTVYHVLRRNEVNITESSEKNTLD